MTYAEFIELVSAGTIVSVSIRGPYAFGIESAGADGLTFTDVIRLDPRRTLTRNETC